MLKALLKVRLKALFSSMFARSVKRSKSKLGKLGFTLLMVYAFGCLLFAVGFMCQSMLPLVQAGLGWLYFGVMGLSALAFCIIGGSFAAKSQMFEAKDNELLLSMPIPMGYLLTCRLLPLLALNLIYGGFFLLPAGVVYAMSCPVTAFGALAFVLGSILLILLGTTLSALFGWVISMLTVRSRHKNLMSTVISLAFLAAYFYFYSNIQKYIGTLVAQGSAIGDAVRRGLPPAYYFGDAVAGGNVLSLLLLCAWCLLPTLIVFLLLRASFLGIMTTKHSAARVRYQARAMRTGTAFSALYRKECRRFFSTTAYLLNSGLGSVMMVAAAVFLAIKGVGFFTNGAALPDGLLPGIAGAIFCFCSVMIMPTASSISLEGHSFPLLRAMPINTRDLFGAKIAVALTLGLPACVLSGLITGVAFRMGIAATLALVLLPSAMLAWMAVFGLILNLHFPKFDWVSETVVVKQSAPVMIATFGGMGFVGAPALLYVFLLRDVIMMTAYLWGMAALFTLLAGLGWQYLEKKGEKLLETI